MNDRAGQPETEPGTGWQVRQPAWAGLAALALAFGFMARLSWNKWADVFVDYGLQAYLPWQALAGRLLYRDLDYILGGPLSQFYHAFLFKVCGVSIHALVVSSLVVAAGLVVVTYEAFRRAADTLTATAIGLVIILGFAFAQYVANGNYNYICPYTSESVHGLALSILCLALLSIWLVKGRAALAGLAGLAFGLVFLTKPEVFLALAAAAAGAWLLAFALRRQFRPFFLGKSAIAFAFGAGLPVWAFFLRFWSAGTTGDAARAVAGAWMPVLAGGAANNAFHRWCIGLDHPAHNAAVTLGWFFGYLAVILILVGFGRAMARRRTLDEQIFLCLIPLGLLAGATAVNWVDCGWVLPPATTAITLHLAWAWWNRGEPARDGRLFLPLLWSVFAFFLLLKIFLHSRIWHYGFYLAMPAMVINVFYLAWWLPHRLGPGRLQVGMFRGAVLLLLAVILCGLVRHSAAYYRLKTFPVGRGADRMFAFPPEREPHGAALARTADWLSQNTPSNATLAVLPEGTMLNYLTRRPNPTPYASLPPPEYLAHGEAKILAAYQAHPPDYIALVHRQSAEFGFGFFGQDPAYGARIMAWIRQNYQSAWLLGEEPLQTNHFGVKVLRRKDITLPLRRQL